MLRFVHSYILFNSLYTSNFASIFIFYRVIIFLRQFTFPVHKLPPVYNEFHGNKNERSLVKDIS